MVVRRGRSSVALRCRMSIAFLHWVHSNTCVRRRSSQNHGAWQRSHRVPAAQSRSRQALALTTLGFGTGRAVRRSAQAALRPTVLASAGYGTHPAALPQFLAILNSPDKARLFALIGRLKRADEMRFRLWGQI